MNKKMPFSNPFKRFQETRAKKKLAKFVKQLLLSSSGTIVEIKEEPRGESVYFVYSHCVKSDIIIPYGFKYSSLAQARMKRHRTASASKDLQTLVDRGESVDQMFWFWKDNQTMENYEHLSPKEVLQCFRIVEHPFSFTTAETYVPLPFQFVEKVLANDIEVFMDYMDQGFGTICDKNMLHEWYSEEDGEICGEEPLILETDLLILQGK